MIEEVLKKAGVKTEEEFYKKYPTEESFRRDFPKFELGGITNNYGVDPKVLRAIAQMELIQKNSQGTDPTKVDSLEPLPPSLLTNIPKSLEGVLGSNYNKLQSNNPEDPTKVDSLEPLPPSLLTNIPTSLVEKEKKGWAYDPSMDEAAYATLLTDLNKSFQEGNIDFDEYQELYKAYNGDPKDMLTQPEKKEIDPEQMLSFLNSAGYANSLGTSAYNIGRFAGMSKGTEGRGLGLVGNIGDFALGATRGILGGLAQSKGTQRALNYYEQRKGQDNRAIANPQYQNANTTGGLISFEKGGEILSRIYQQQSSEEDPRYREGEYIEFEYGGEIKKGKIKKVVGGKIYL